MPEVDMAAERDGQGFVISELSTMMISCGEDDGDNCLVDTSVFVSSPTGAQGGMQPMPDDTQRPSSREARAKPQYNRSTIKIEVFLSKTPETITAKEYRVLIPTMFQMYLHPNKDLAKTKVKGLWEPGNRPHGWPIDVKFRDPNNNPKFHIRESKVVFAFLKEKLCEWPKYKQYLTEYPRVKPEPKKSPASPKSRTQFNFPNIPSLQLTPNHGSFSTQEEIKTLMMPQLSQPSRSMQPAGETLPNLVQQDFGVTLMDVKSEPATLEFYYEDEQRLNGMLQPQMVEVVSTSENVADQGSDATKTSLTLLQNAAVPCEMETPSFPTEAQQPNVMLVCAPGDESVAHPLNPQGSDVVQPVDVPTIASCVTFAKGIQENLLPTVVEFSKTFEKNYTVLQKVEDLIKDTFVPIFNMAKCSKAMCAELSKLGSRLQEMLKRFSFMYENYDTNEIIAELDVLQQDFKMQEIVLSVPEPSHEVMVMTVTNDTAPTLADPSNPYIPTISGLEARAQQKARQLETEKSGDLGPVHYEDCKDKVSVMSPVCKELEEMYLDEGDDTSSLHPEKDCGIKLVDAEEGMGDSAPMDIEQIMKELDFLNHGNDLGIDVRPATTEEINEVAEILPAAPTPTQPMAVSTPAAIQTLSPVVAQTDFAQPETNIFQMSLENGGFHCHFLEDQAVDASLQAAFSHFGGSLTIDKPPVISADDTSYITDDVLSLEQDFNLSILSSLEGFPDAPPLPLSTPGQTQVSIPVPPQEDVFTKLRNKQPEAVIPITVYEAAERAEGPTAKRARSKGKAAARRNSEGGAIRGKGKTASKRL